MMQICVLSLPACTRRSMLEKMDACACMHADCSFQGYARQLGAGGWLEFRHGV